MIYCKYCRNKKGCVYAGEDCTREECVDHIPTTNADHIREMTDEELKEFLCEFGQECNQCCAQDYCHYGHNGMLEWLRKEYEQ